ncbi:MAG: hypothetical protein HY22_02225 [[Candidatus Thermochlorobacteriaceae] bacterium GBChlB]|nr:MAG: hypothetical protein HY22_02225 [[Candidatus Thermochlorobacteriaceae] bacterium GBChlB]
MNWLNQLATRLGVMRIEVLLVTGLLGFLLAGVGLNLAGEAVAKKELFERAEAEMFMGEESDSALTAEQRLYDESLKESGSDVRRTDLPRKKLNFNTATEADLEALPDIGDLLANRLIRFRAFKGGKIRALEELLEVKGITQERFERLKLYLTVE